MYQLVREKQRHVEPARTRSIEPARASAVGKRTLTQDLNLGAPDYYKHAVDSARRELRAVRAVILPAFVKALRGKDVEPLARQIELTTMALQARHVLMTANAHVKALEKAAWFRDPMVLFLRHDLDTLAARAAKVGVYRGAEDMMPRAHVEETRQPTARGETALRVRNRRRSAA